MNFFLWFGAVVAGLWAASVLFVAVMMIVEEYRREGVKGAVFGAVMGVVTVGAFLLQGLMWLGGVALVLIGIEVILRLFW